MSQNDALSYAERTTEDRRVDELRAALADSALFNADWYRRRYAALIGDTKDELRHFVRSGATAGLRPCPLFDTAWYLGTYAQARRSGLDPLQHFLRYGKTERLKPNRLFDTNWYLETYRAAAISPLDPLSHYLLEGSPDCRPHILFDSTFYAASFPESATASQNPLEHYFRIGAAEGAAPNPFFDARWYLDSYQDARLSRLDPLSHFLEFGAPEDYRPTPLFDTAWYRTTYLTGSQVDANPLAHFIERGASLETQPNPFFHFSTYADAAVRETETRASLLRNYMADESNLCLPAVSARNAGLGRGMLRLLYMDANYPRPNADSGSVDAFNNMKILLTLGFEITFIATTDFFAAGAIRNTLQDLGIDCVDTYKFSAVETFLECCGSRFDVVVLSRVYAGGHFFELVRSVARKATIVFNPVDLHYLRESREAALFAHSSLSATIDWTRSRELYLTRRCDMTLVVSTLEKEILKSEVPTAKITTMPLLRDIVGRVTAFHAREGIGFVGGFGHRPNLDAVAFFLDMIWPLIIEKAPGLYFEVVGADLPEEFRRRQDRNVVFSGHVMDLGTVLSRWRLTVAPLRYGAGAKGKIVSSLAHGVPCVATPVAAEGMGLRKGLVPVVGDPLAFASAVLDLYHDEDAWMAASDAGLKAVMERNDVCRGANLWADLLARAGVAGFHTAPSPVEAA